jgi:hypothetical protein
MRHVAGQTEKPLTVLRESPRILRVALTVLSYL